jgi:hypothetical protein
MNWNSPRGNRGYGNDSRGRGRDDRGDRGDDRQQQFPNSGALLPSKNRRSENSPDYYGDITISDEVLDYVLRNAESGGEVRLELSGWSRMTRNNLNLTSLKINIPYSVRQQEGGNPTYRGRYDRGREPQRGRQPSYREQSGRGRDETDERDMFKREGSYERDDRRGNESRTRDDDRGDPRGNRYPDEPPPHKENPRDEKPGFFDDEIPF